MEELTARKSADFLDFIRNYNGSYTWFIDVKLWIQSGPRYKKCLTVEQLKARMRKDPYFEERHFKKLDKALECYLNNELL